ncbi:TMEM175 family protein [Aliikangiella sp. IMCC44653]
MALLTQKFLNECPSEKGFRMRGIQTTRLEAFIDAAFAFAVTMLVISFDAIPQSFDEMILAIKTIPAFIFAVVQLVWVWHTHNIWSRRFGLDTTYVVVLSTALLILVLIYVYPMRTMAAGMFAWLTNGYLPSSFKINSLDELRTMFIFLGVGFSAICLVFVQMYRYALNLKEQLVLNFNETFECSSFILGWSGAAASGVLCIILALFMPAQLVPLSGFAFALLAVWFPLISGIRTKQKAKILASQLSDLS